MRFLKPRPPLFFVFPCFNPSSLAYRHSSPQSLTFICLVSISPPLPFSFVLSSLGFSLWHKDRLLNPAKPMLSTGGRGLSFFQESFFFMPHGCLHSGLCCTQLFFASFLSLPFRTPFHLLPVLQCPLSSIFSPSSFVLSSCCSYHCSCCCCRFIHSNPPCNSVYSLLEPCIDQSGSSFFLSGLLVQRSSFFFPPMGDDNPYLLSRFISRLFLFLVSYFPLSFLFFTPFST